MEQFQVGHGWERSRLYSSAVNIRLTLRRRIAKEAPRGTVEWRRQGTEKWRSSANPLAAALAIVKAARELKGHSIFEVRGTGKDGPRLALHRYTAEPPSPGTLPKAAMLLAATRRTVRFHEEIHLAVPGARPLGLYVPRPLRDDTPPTWRTGMPWPRNAYASEHAWAAADDCGVDNAAGDGYAVEPLRIGPVLEDVTSYTLTNYTRLGVVDHIHNRVRWRRRPDGTPMLERYGGSDPHDTHTHTAFGDHGGSKPPWL